MRLTRRSGPARISAEELEAAHEAGAHVIDVREADEWAAGHLPFAVHIPLGQLRAHANELDPERLTVFVCRSGQRSGTAAGAFAQAHFNVANLVGGMKACRNAGLSIINDDGAPGAVI